MPIAAGRRGDAARGLRGHRRSRSRSRRPAGPSSAPGCRSLRAQLTQRATRGRRWLHAAPWNRAASRSRLTDVPRASSAWQMHPDYPLIARQQSRRVLRAQHAAGGLVGPVPCRCWPGATRKPAAPGSASTAAAALRWSPTCARRAERNPHAPSRGALVVAALQSRRGRQRAGSTRHAPRARARTTASTCWWAMRWRCATAVRPARRACTTTATGSTRGPRPLAPGIYGLSNAFLDTPWPKVVRAVARVRHARIAQQRRHRVAAPADGRPPAGARQRAAVRPACRSTGSARCRRCRSAPTATARASTHRGHRAARRRGQLHRAQLRPGATPSATATATSSSWSTASGAVAACRPALDRTG
ncbi:MAG: hypothetical protein MZW92_48590 [Comamonadaceae bacterium]|nr:hypothetical protein [Comamonadaceae bacterium]